jgi:hypothetical protein
VGWVEVVWAVAAVVVAAEWVCSHENKHDLIE